MKQLMILLALLSLFVLTGCATIEPAYRDSHQVMLEKTVETMDVQQALRVKVWCDASIAFPLLCAAWASWERTRE